MLLAGVRAGSPAAAAEEARVEELSGEMYFPKTLEVLKGAREEIWVGQFLIDVTAEGKAGELVDALIEAHGRGVPVHVLMEGEKARDRNALAYARLKEAGVDVSADAEAALMHAKTVLVDGEIAIVGSHNWTESALSDNREQSVLIRSPEIVSRLRAYLEEIPKRRGLRAVVEEGARVPEGFFGGGGCLAQMVGNNDERALDAFLLILREEEKSPHPDPLPGGERVRLILRRPAGRLRMTKGKGRLRMTKGKGHLRMTKAKEVGVRPLLGLTPLRGSWIEISGEAFAEALGLSGRMDRTAARRQIVKALRKLERRYGLITVEAPYGQAYRVKVASSHRFFAGLRPAQNDTGSDAGRLTVVPFSYWEMGWAAELSLQEKAAFLTAFRETQKNGDVSFAGPVKRLAAESGLKEEYLSGGFAGLRRRGLVTIFYSSVEEGYHPRANLYWLRPLYSFKERQERIAELSARLGKERFEKAREAARLVYKSEEPGAIERIARILEEGEPEAWKKALTIVSLKEEDNPKRNFGYLLATYEGLRRDRIGP